MLSIQFNALGKSAQAVAIFAVTVIVAVGSSARETNSRSGASSASPSLPLSFEPNQGQSKNGVLFVARGPGYVLYLNEQGSSFQFSSGIGMSDSPTPLFGISLAGAKKSEKSKTNMLGMDEQPSKSSYYTGSDPKKWFTGIPNFSRVERRGVYEGIDATYRGSQGELECEFKVAPQANPGTIALEIVGVQGLRREAQGDIVFTIANVEMRLHRPAAYQETDGSTQSAVTSRYVLTGNIVTLRLGPYDRRKPLFINPVLSYSGLLKLQGANSLPGALSLPQELFFNKPTPCFELRTPALWPSTSLRSNDLQPNTYRSNMPFRTLANSVLSLAILMTAATLPCAAQGKTGATVVATIPADAFPVAVAVNPRTRKAYIANNTGGDVTIIDERTNASKTIADIGGSFANAIAVNTVTNKIYVANTESGNVLVIDGATNHRTEVSDPNGGFPLSIAVDPGLNKIYVGNYTTNNVTVIDGRTNATTTVADPNAQGPRCVAVNPVTHKVYLGNDITGNITIIDGLTNTVSTAGDPNAFSPFAVDVNPITNKIYFANFGSSNITVLDGATDSTLTVTDPNSFNPVGIAVNPITNKIYAAAQFPANVIVIDGATNQFTTVTNPKANQGQAIAVDTSANKVYMANFLSGNITVVDGTTDQLSATVTDPKAIAPYAVRADPVTHRVFVANSGSANVTVLDGSR